MLEFHSGVLTANNAVVKAMDSSLPVTQSNLPQPVSHSGVFSVRVMQICFHDLV